MRNFLLHIFRPLTLAALLMLPAACSDDGETFYEGEETSAPTIEMELTEPWNDEYIAVKFTPSQNASAFIYAIGKEGDRSGFISGNLETRKSEGNESQIILFEDLEADKEYVVFAVALDREELKGPLSTIAANTFEGDIKTWVRFAAPTSLGYSFKASSLDYRAFEYALVTTLDDIAKFEKQLSYNADYESGVIQGSEEYANKTLLLDPVYKFTGTYFDLTPETKYYVLYRAQDRYSREWTQTFVREVVTASKDTSPYVDVNIDYVDFFYSKATFTPNDHVSKYYVYTTTPDPFGGLLSHGSYAGDVLSAMRATINSYIEYAGVKTDNFGLDFIQDYTMSFYIAVYDVEEEIVSVQFYPYKTPKYDDAAPEAEIKIIKVDARPGKLTYTFEPNDATLMFFVETFTEEGLRENNLETDLDFTNLFERYYLRAHGQMAHRYMSDGSWWKTVWEEEYSVDEYPSGTKFTLVAAPMNVNGLNGWGKVAKYEFTLP